MKSKRDKLQLAVLDHKTAEQDMHGARRVRSINTHVTGTYAPGIMKEMESVYQ